MVRFIESKKMITRKTNHGIKSDAHTVSVRATGKYEIVDNELSKEENKKKKSHFHVLMLMLCFSFRTVSTFAKDEKDVIISSNRFLTHFMFVL